MECLSLAECYTLTIGLIKGPSGDGELLYIDDERSNKPEQSDIEIAHREQV